MMVFSSGARGGGGARADIDGINIRPLLTGRKSNREIIQIRKRSNQKVTNKTVQKKLQRFFSSTQNRQVCKLKRG